MDLRHKICNLCLVKCENYTSIEGNMKTALDILLPTIEFTIIPEPVMCKNCEEMLWKCYAFKEKCLNSYDDSVSLNNKDAAELDLKDVCLRKNTTGDGVSEGHKVCGLCFNFVKSCAVSVDVDRGRVILEKMIEQCLPELDLSVIKNPIICSDCHRSLETCFYFVTNCLAAEEKIKKYFESLDIDSKSQIDLNSLLNSIMRTVEVSDIDGNIGDIIEAEKLSYMKIENPSAIKLEQMPYDDNEYIVSGNKNKSISDCAEEDNTLDTVKTEIETKPEDGDVGEIDEQKCILNEEIEIKTDDHDFNRYEESIFMTQTRVNTSFTSRQKCLISKSKNEIIPHIEQSLLKNHATKMTIVQCECGLCQRKKTKRHLLIHEVSSEVTMFKCGSCPYQSSRKNLYKNHMLIHMDSSEVTMFKCDSCSFQTKWKHSLNVHLLQHMDPSELTMFKCDTCPFQAKKKDNLNRHMLKHMDPSEITMFKCDSCPYQSHWKISLKNHVLKHMDSSKVTMFKCDSCSFQTRRKVKLKSHALKHMDHSEVTMFKCDSCSYQSHWKISLKNHVLKHMDSSKVTMFQCDSCPFQTRQKEKLKRHALKHMDPSEVTMFKCDSCPYQVRWKDNLKKHMLQHMESSEVTMFVCDICSFQTKYNFNLKQHMKIHKATTKVTTFKCDFCSFQSVSKCSLKTHLVTHKKIQNRKKISTSNFE